MCSRSACSPTARTASGWNGVSGNVTGLFYGGGGGGQLIAQMFEVVVGFIWAWGIAWVIFSIAKRFMKIRVSEEAEIEGLDIPEFGALCYPDFVLHNSPAGHVMSAGADIPAVEREETRS